MFNINVAQDSKGGAGHGGEGTGAQEGAGWWT